MKISTTQQKVDHERFGSGYEAIFGERCIKHPTTERPCPQCDGAVERIIVDGKQLWRPLETAIKEYEK